MADPELLPPDPPRTNMTVGELASLQGRPVDSARANHPVGCAGCLHIRRPHDDSLAWTQPSDQHPIPIANIHMR